MAHWIHDDKLMDIISNIVESDFSKKVIEESIEKAKELNAPSDFMALICNAIPKCE